MDERAHCHPAGVRRGTRLRGSERFALAVLWSWLGLDGRALWVLRVAGVFVDCGACRICRACCFCVGPWDTGHPAGGSHKLKKQLMISSSAASEFPALARSRVGPSITCGFLHH